MKGETYYRKHLYLKVKQNSPKIILRKDTHFNIQSYYKTLNILWRSDNVKVLVTGGTGFIGSHIVDLLLDKGHEVVIIDNFSNAKLSEIPSNVKLYKLDLLSEKVEKVFIEEKIEVVIHHAAQIDVKKSIENPVDDANSNILGTVKILDYCRIYKVRKFIFASSCAVYGDIKDGRPIAEDNETKPISFYGISKYTAEMYIKLYQKFYGLSYTIFRYANVYGPRQSPDGKNGVISIFSRKMLHGEKPIIFGDGQQEREFIFVKDVAEANLLALNGGDNQVFNIGTGTKITLNNLIKYINEVIGSNIEAVYKDAKAGDIRSSHLDSQDVRKILNWQPKYSLKNGLKETIEYYKA